MDSKLLKKRAVLVKIWKRLNKERKNIENKSYKNRKELSLIEGAIFVIDARL